MAEMRRTGASVRDVVGKVPTYAELPSFENTGDHCAWDFFGRDDQLGTLNFLTADRFTWTPRFLELCGHHAIEPVACSPYWLHPRHWPPLPPRQAAAQRVDYDVTHATADILSIRGAAHGRQASLVLRWSLRDHGSVQ